MRKALASAMVVAAVCSLMTAAQAAQDKPIQALPGDLVKWSTLWVEIPKEMYSVGQDAGPLAAVTWGPVKGAAALVNVTTKTLWDAAQQKTPQGRRTKGGQPVGPLLRYEF